MEGIHLEEDHHMYQISSAR